MFIKYLLRYFASGWLVLMPNLTFAQQLAIRNVHFVQRSDEKVIIKYDLIGDPSKSYTLKLSLYLPDSRETISLDRKTLIGHVGRDVTPGRGKRIGWDLPRDFPDGLHGEGYVFIIDAFEQNKSVWPWFLGGVGAAGAMILLFSPGEDPVAADLDLPPPPDLPSSP